jgi:hypothetical protein
MPQNTFLEQVTSYFAIGAGGAWVDLLFADRCFKQCERIISRFKAHLNIHFERPNHEASTTSWVPYLYGILGVMFEAPY